MKVMTHSMPPREILLWYAEMGVDEAIGEEAPNRYLAKPRESVAPRPPMPAGAAAPLVLPGTQDSTHPAAKATTLEALKDALAAYEGCALKRSCQRTVFADGNPKAAVMLVGEAPGADEDRIGLPFVGASGKLLDRMLASIGLGRDSVYITNVVPWRPPGNRKPEPAEIAQCLPFIRRHVELASPRFLLFLGGSPANALLGGAEAISRMRGQWRDCVPADGARPIPALPTFHPAYLLRTPLHKRLAWADFLALRKRLDDVGL